MNIALNTILHKASQEYKNKTKKEQKKMVSDMVKSLKKSNKEYRKNGDHKLQYCNKTRKCKGTEFEMGDDKKIMKKVFKKFYLSKTYKNATPKDKKGFEDEFLALRKHLFNGKKNIVDNDGFYIGLSPENIKEMKKEGAISGCNDKNEIKEFKKPPQTNQPL